MYSIFDSLRYINNIKTDLNNITPRKVNVKLYGYDKLYIDKNLIEDKLHQLKDQLSKRKFNYWDFYFVLVNNTHYFMMEMEDWIRGYNFNKTSSIVN